MLTSSFNSHLVLLSQVLYQQFKFFLNLYFLVVACSQFVPSLKIGHLYTYWAPLVTLSTLFTDCTLKSSSIWKNCLSWPIISNTVGYICINGIWFQSNSYSLITKHSNTWGLIYTMTMLGLNYTVFVISSYNLFFISQGFVLAVTMVREAVDEVRRYQRDKEMNSQLYSKLTVRGKWNDYWIFIHSSPTV